MLNPALSINITGIQENLNNLMAKVIKLTKINSMMLKAKQDSLVIIYKKKKNLNKLDSNCR